MVRKRIFSVYSDFKTGFLCRLFLILGVIFLIMSIILHFTSLISLDENTKGAIIAFTILFFGLGILVYFISCQFTKLAKIAEEIEKENKIDNIEKTQE